MTVTGTTSDKTRQTGGRMHHLDVLRAFLLLQVVPYHAAILYSTQPDWFVKSDETSLFMTWISGSLGMFSMTGFFLISGWLTVRFLQTRPVDRWMRIRLERLGIPFISCMLLLGPLSILAGHLAAQDGVAAAQAEYSGSYWANLMVPDARWLGHLWFLPTLLTFSAIIWFACKRGWYEPVLGWLTRRVNAMPGSLASLLLIAAVFCIWRTGAETADFMARNQYGYEPPLLGIADFKRLAVHFPAILLGLMIGYSAELRDRLVQATPFRIASVLLFAGIFIALSSAERFELQVLQAVIKNGLGVVICLVLIAGLEKVFREPKAWAQFISRHSYSVYLFHFPVVVLLGVAFRQLAWPPVLEFLLITLAAFAISLSLGVLVSRSRMLSLVFNGVPPGEYKQAPRTTLRTTPAVPR